METKLPGTPERLGGKPRLNAEDAYATFMDMSESQWNLFYGSEGVPFGLTTPEAQGYAMACVAKHVPLTPQAQEPDEPSSSAATDEAIAVQPETITTPEGFVLIEETGEIIRHVSEPFAVRDRNSAEWVLEKLAEADAAIYADAARLAAVTEHIQSRIKAQEQRRNWLRTRFAGELEQYAAGQLAGQKARTLVLDNGKISFRKTPGSTTVTDMAAAVAWAKENAPEAVKVTETVLVSPLKNRDDLPEDIFTVTPPGEKCTIETGVK